MTYKELVDFKTGARVNVVMSPFAANMSNQDMLDVAAYYAFLPRVPSNNLDPTIPAPPIVATGAPMRNIAPCGSCHGDIDTKAGSPWLGGQSAVYIKAQLQCVRVRRPAQRHQPADAQYCPPDDGGRDRPGRPLLRSSTIELC